jgi:kynurenine formamidase
VWPAERTKGDGARYLSIDNIYYNGNKAADFADISGLKKLGVEKIPPIVTRGVLLDMTAHFKTDMLTEGVAFNQKEIEAAAKAQGVDIRKGDVVLFHTGWLQLIGKDNARFSAAEPGLGVQGANYLADKGVVAVGADTWGLEVIPFEEDAGLFEVHQTLLAKHGVYILENIRTDELAADKAYEFMFVLGHPKYTGAVQSIINPIAIR